LFLTRIYIYICTSSYVQNSPYLKFCSSSATDRLACQLGGTDDDNLIIRNLPLFLSDTARAWLEHLPPGQISNWDDLVQAFADNFQGMYVRPGNSWDLRSCRQQPGESLRDYIR
jgi:hypothetical protein